MTHFEIRKKFLHFFRQSQHEVLKGSSLIPQNDPSLLFVNAGMNQFKNVFLGLEAPPAKNAVTIQKCLRAGGKHNDLEEVGETPLHHTFFEMLGNFSFGGYFKKEAIRLAWEFLTKELEIPEEYLWVTVHKTDKESYELWRDDRKIPEHKIYKLGDEDNFWQMGETGPCGPCSEIHYYTGKEKNPKPSQFMEIWNLVFMEFNRKPDGSQDKLPVPSVDTGMGLERLCSVMQNKKSNYHTDLFSGIIQRLEKCCSLKYDFEEKKQDEIQKAFRVVADHSRAAGFLMSDAVLPGNDSKEYVLKRIIRRALYYGQKLEPSANLLMEGLDENISLMSELSRFFEKEGFLEYKDYFNLKSGEQDIRFHIKNEHLKFAASLKEGKKRLEDEMKSSSQKRVSAQSIWNLYSTYGFPMDLTRLIAKERGWETASEEEVKKHEKSVEKQVHQTENMDFKALAQNQPATLWTAYKKEKEQAQILSVLDVHPRPATTIKFNLTDRPRGDGGVGIKPFTLVLDKSCFYPEGGGPIGDMGWITTENAKAVVLDCQKKGNVIAHEVGLFEGELTEKDKVEMGVDQNFRKQISASHTATHLLNSALRSVLGANVRQAGSLVEPGRLRFDFTHPRPLTKKECQQLEDLVSQSIDKKEKVSSSQKSFEEAKQEGALYLQGENYGKDNVRVIRIGDKTSTELCGGIHVQNTGEIEQFKIISEKGVQAGVRRITAYTGALAEAWEKKLLQENERLRKCLDSFLDKNQEGKENLLLDKEQVEKENPFLKWLKYREQKMKTLKRNIVCLEDQGAPSSRFKPGDRISVQNQLGALIQQTLELSDHLKLSFPKERSIGGYFAEKIYNSISEKKIPNSTNEEDLLFEGFFKETDSLEKEIKTKKEELDQLQDQWQEMQKRNLTKSALLKKAKAFEFKNSKGSLLTASFPLKDRKILSDLSDTLLSALSSGVLVLLGEDKEKSLICVSVTKNFQKDLPAGKLLKDIIAPFCGGRGGGKPSFAQGSISNPSAFSKLEKELLKHLAS